MNISALFIERVVSEIKFSLEGAFFHRAFQTADDEFVIALRRGDEKFFVETSFSPINSRICLACAPRAEERAASTFASVLKNSLAGLRLERLNQIDGDRIVRFDFASGDVRRSLVAELTGSSGNMYLLDESEKTISVALQRKSRNSLGSPYLPPPPIKPSAVKSEESFGEVGTGAFAFNDWLRAAYQEPVMRERIELARLAAFSPLRNAAARLAKRKKDLRAESERIAAYAGDKKLADLLQINFHLMKRGEARLEVVDVFDPEGKSIVVPLDPSLAPADNLQRYYKRFRKFEKGAPRIESELSALDEQTKERAAKIAAIESAADLAALSAFASPAANKDKPRRPPTKSEKKEKATGAKRFVSPDGLTILVGRNDKENDEIAFKIANGRDIWLHARDYPGSHVLVRAPKGTQVPPSTLRAAAMLALHYSKAAKAGKGEVTHCFAKELKKPKGAPPGKVLVSGAKSIMVAIDEDEIRAMRSDRPR